jgi:HEAT repeat protein
MLYILSFDTIIIDGGNVVLEVYVVGELTTALERKQMDRLISYLRKEFGNRQESCIVIIEPSIPHFHKDGQPYLRKNGTQSTARPDALIIKDNFFVLIELKGLKGEIPIDYENRPKLNAEEDNTQNTPIYDAIIQAKGHRITLISYLVTKFKTTIIYPPEVEPSEEGNYVARNINSWIITEENTTLNYKHEDKKPRYLEVLPLEKLTDELKWLKNTKNLLPKNQLTHFLTELNAKRVPDNQWYRGPLFDAQIPSMHISKIVNWIETNDISKIRKALEYIKEFELTDQLSLVFKCWKNQNHTVRQDALSIILKWQPQETDKILKEALQDPEPNIRKLTLKHVKKNKPHEPTENLLTEHLHHSQKTVTPKETVTLIKTIAASQSDTSKNLLYEYSQHFQEIKITEKKNEHPVLLTLIEALGTIGCKESIFWFKQIIEKPTTLGFENDNYNSLQNNTDYTSIFKETCKALSKTATKEDTDTIKLLISKLKQAPENYQQSLIQALGTLGNPLAGPAILPYIKNADNPFFNDAIQAIVKMEYQEKIVFYELYNHYKDNTTLTHSKAHRIEKTLATLFPERFEKILSKKILNPDTDTKQRTTYLRIFFTIANEKSKDILFTLINDSNPKISNKAIQTLIQLSKNSNSIQQKAKEYLKTNDPNKKSAAIRILAEYFKEKLQELTEFSKDNSEKVRMSVAKIYSWANAKEELLQYATDPDKQIRNTVFNNITTQAIKNTNGTLVSNNKKYGQCDLCINDKIIAFNLPNEILIIPKHTTKNHRIINNDQEFTNIDKNEIYGIYFEHQQQQQPNKTEKLLYFHTTPNNQTAIKKIFQQIIKPTNNQTTAAANEE